ncbi:hypothetical protein [Gymnodinialimonas hymeniacidonis]|uniref:hypothetical protein n=1 Tax=Gymnodinialimonas hymeniacidonis TaxID=3126508 RepID=UPI0034C5FA07
MKAYPFFVLVCALGLVGSEGMAFSAEACAENYIADDLPEDARATALPEYFVEPGQLGSPLICTLVPSEVYGPMIQVSAAIADDPNTAFVQYFPDNVQILRTDGEGAGLVLSACGPIPQDLPPERNPGGFWCRIDVSVGRGVVFDLEYDAEGALAWLNFEVSALDTGILANSTLAPVLGETAPNDIRAGLFLDGSDTTFLMRHAQAADVFRMVELQSIIDLYRAQRDTPQAMTIVIETGEPETGPFAQIDLPARLLSEIMAELALLEDLVRTHRGL